jgi:sugar O-acyltransferase (sialic acid O-acetyltransferase NeuD family)
MIIIGYSGHSFGVCDAFASACVEVKGYCDTDEKQNNPYQLEYLGSEQSEAAIRRLTAEDYFVSVGDNKIRAQISASLQKVLKKDPAVAIHQTACVSPKAKLAPGVLVSANAAINALADLGRGVIANTGCIIEHECIIGEFAHICPGTVLAGNVTIGANSFIGANSVVRQGVRIGSNVIVGAGAVVVSDIPDNVCVVGNPAKVIKQLA